jgi:hypothetical protein
MRSSRHEASNGISQRTADRRQGDAGRTSGPRSRFTPSPASGKAPATEAATARAVVAAPAHAIKVEPSQLRYAHRERCSLPVPRGTGSIVDSVGQIVCARTQFETICDRNDGEQSSKIGKTGIASLRRRNFCKPLTLLNILGRVFLKWRAKVAKIAKLFAIVPYLFGDFGRSSCCKTPGGIEFFGEGAHPGSRRRENANEIK